MYRDPSLAYYKKPKRKVLKVVLLTIILLILGFGIWIGATFIKTFKKVTSFSSGGSILAFLGDSDQKLKGQSEGRTNILLLGMGGKNHPGGQLTDTIIVLSIDWQTKKVAMISIPRDLWVPIPNYGSAKINEAYVYGEKNTKLTGGGGKVTSDVVSKVLGIPVHYFVTIDFEGFKRIVDTVGGVDIYVEKELYDPFYPANNMVDYAPFRIKAGQQHMNGETALKYARSRKTTSDFDRSKRQEQVLVAIKQKVFTLNTLSNPKKITDLLNILGDHVRTNLSIGEIKSLWGAVKDLDTANMVNKVLDTDPSGPLTSSTSSAGAYIILPKKGAGNFTDLQYIAKNIFSLKETLGETSSALQIEVLNGTGKNGIAASFSKDLENRGYEIAKIGEASKLYPDTVVYSCSKKNESQAKTIADLLGGQIKTKTGCGSLDIQVIIGQSTLR